MLKDKVILGENAIYSTDSNVTGLNNNIMVVAGSGAGNQCRLWSQDFSTHSILRLL